MKEALALNEPLATAYYLKDDLRRFWEQPGKAFATTFLDGWIRRAESSGIKILQQMAKTLAAHRTGLLAYYDVMISSGPMEGTNNKIKTMKRQAYGFRDMEFFKLKILAIHETRYALIGWTIFHPFKLGAALKPDEPENIPRRTVAATAVAQHQDLLGSGVLGPAVFIPLGRDAVAC